jgi:hypothetical protein
MSTYSFYRFGISKNWNTLQVFLLHLAFCDILYCAFALPFYSSLYIGQHWIFGELWCKLTPIFAFTFAYVGWIALTLIAVSRALSLLAPSFLNSVCDNGRSKLIILVAWMFVLVIMIPSLMEVSTFC